MSQTFEDLKVYKLAMGLAVDIEKMTRALPGSELFRYTDQILRSSRSIVANIVEGYGRKFFKKDFIRFLTFALASCDETQAHASMIYASGLMNNDLYRNLNKKCKDISVRLQNFINAIQINDLKKSKSNLPNAI